METSPNDQLQRCNRLRNISKKYSDMAENNDLHIDLLIAYSRRSLLIGELAQKEYRKFKSQTINAIKQ